MTRSDYAVMVIRTVTTGSLLSLDVYKDIRAVTAPWTRGRTL